MDLSATAPGLRRQQSMRPTLARSCARPSVSILLPSLQASGPAQQRDSHHPALAAKPSASIYRHPGFLAFISARLMAVFATQIQAVVVAWQVYDLTRDPLALVPAAVLGGLCTPGVVGGWTLGFKQLRTVDRFEEAANAH